MSRALVEGFTLEAALPVDPPYRLDLTVDVLRRLSANVVDVVDGSGTYRRVLSDSHGANLIEVRQPDPRTLHLRIAGRNAERWLPTARTMLGADVSMNEWRRRIKGTGWLEELGKRFEGVRPPRYPTLWEALAHAIVFQQISIVAAGAIMRRTIEALCHPPYSFFSPTAILKAPDQTLREAGLSSGKIAHLRSAAAAVQAGLSGPMLEQLDSSAAAERLREIRGIGPWSAALVLLRGLGRLDVFPLRDSGVARSIVDLSGNPGIEPERLLERLGPVRGMLYFHLLLGRMHKEP